MIQVVLFVFAGVVLGVSVDKGFVNPAWSEHAFVGLAVFFVACLIVALLGPQSRLVKTLRTLVFDSSRGVFNVMLFMVGGIAYSLVSWKLFQATPHLDDSVSAFFHAKMFAAGHATIPLPERPEFFAMTCMVDSRHGLNHMASMYPPGFPAVFVPLLFLGIPWATNPLLGGGLVVVTGCLARELYDDRVGRVASVLTLLSPFVMLQSGTFLSHVPTAFFLVLCMWSVCRLLRYGSIKYGCFAGIGFGIAFLCRPLTALLTGALIALAPLVCWRRSLKYWKAVIIAGLLAVMAAGILAAFQKTVTGDYGTPGHEIGMGDRGRMGFGRLDRSVTHSPDKGWDHTRLRMKALNHKVLGWPVPMFLIALLPFFLFRAGFKELWLLAPTLALLAVYFTFWYYEFFYEARYIFSGVPMLLVLCARGYTCFQDRLGRHTAIATCLFSGCIAFQLFVYLPHYLGSYNDNHADVESVLPRVMKARSVSNAIVFMDGTGKLPEDSTNNPKNSFYATGFIRNNLMFDGDVVYARYIKGKNHLLAKDHPDRSYYLYRYHRSLNKAALYTLEFDGRTESHHLVEPTSRESFLLGQNELER